MLPHAIAIKIPFWQDPQGSLALAFEQVDSTCAVFFAVWDDAGENQLEQIGKITFADCWAISTLRTEFLPYTPEPHPFTSYLLEVPDSAWLAAVTQQRLQTYASWKIWDKRPYKHYAVQGANGYVEVIATYFTAGLASPAESERYAFLKE